VAEAIMKIGAILAATDLRPASRPALTAAFELGRRLDVPVTVLHVTAPLAERSHWGASFFEEDLGASRERQRAEEQAARAKLEREIADLGGRGARAIVMTGHEAPTILQTAREEAADLVILGTTGRREHIGSVAERVVRSSRTPVLVVPAS
jgi:nucleotide-binding universal stress UspA family protein